MKYKNKNKQIKMIQILIIFFVPMLAFFIFNNRKKDMKQLFIIYCKLFLQSILFIFGKTTYFITLACHSSIELLERIGFDEATATVAQIRDILKISHNKAYEIYQKHHDKITRKKFTIFNYTDELPSEDDEQ